MPGEDRATAVAQAGAALDRLCARVEALAAQSSPHQQTPPQLAEEMRGLRSSLLQEAAAARDVAAQAEGLAARRRSLAARNAELRREATALKRQLADQRGWGVDERCSVGGASGAASGDFLRDTPEVADLNQYW